MKNPNPWIAQQINLTTKDDEEKPSKGSSRNTGKAGDPWEVARAEVLANQMNRMLKGEDMLVAILAVAACFRAVLKEVPRNIRKPIMKAAMESIIKHKD